MTCDGIAASLYLLLNGISKLKKVWLARGSGGILSF